MSTTASESCTVDPTWTTGDFTIISSDEVEFRVDSVYLFAASTVFRDAAAIGTNASRRVELSDPDFETAPAVRMFLRLCVYGDIELVVTGGTSPNIETLDNIVELARLLRLLMKYQCPAQLHAFNLWLHVQVYNNKSPLGVFTLASLQNEKELCTLALSRTGVWSPGDHPRHSPFPTIGHPTADRAGMPLAFWRLIPIDYLWALGRARLAFPGDRVEQGKDFLLFLDVAKSAPKAALC